MKGIYCLILNVKKTSSIKIGALGTINFQKGAYCYIGSAQNNLQKRISRHFKKEKKIHWHIDYLTTHKNIIVQKAFTKKANKEGECLLAKKLPNNHPIPKFGCSDCKCSSHLFLIKEPPKNLKEFNFSK